MLWQCILFVLCCIKLTVKLVSVEPILYFWAHGMGLRAKFLSFVFRFISSFQIFFGKKTELLSTYFDWNGFLRFSQGACHSYIKSFFNLCSVSVFVYFVLSCLCICFWVCLILCRFNGLFIDCGMQFSSKYLFNVKLFNAKTFYQNSILQSIHSILD